MRGYHKGAVSAFTRVIRDGFVAVVHVVRPAPAYCMYATCLFCSSALGANESVEHFPVGRRLAFDAAKGRLWVVCRKCERWNLTPLEERWEAIEECERAFRATKRRVSTEHIGLARLRDGTELVRIGDPQRPEMAAWRYGDQFGRRTRRNVAYGIGATVLIVGVTWGGPAIGLSGGAGSIAMQLAGQWYQRRRPVTHVTVTGDDGESRRLALALLHVSRTSLKSGPDGRWSIDVPYLSGADRLEYTHQGLRHLTERVTLTGEEAQRAAAQILPHVNTLVGSKDTVHSAVRVIEDAGSADAVFGAAACRSPKAVWNIFRGKAMAGSLAALPAPIRLALEMAANEDAERRALEGELHVLEAAWKDADVIAGIADDLLLPDSVVTDLARLKQKADG